MDSTPCYYARQVWNLHRLCAYGLTEEATYGVIGEK
jgi:hypothetical protein